MKSWVYLGGVSLLIFTWAGVRLAGAQAGGPIIGPIGVETQGPINKYAKFEISFPVETVASNPYFPHDPGAPAGVGPGIGITVNGLFLPPGKTVWANARVVPCFYYQPVEELGVGENAALVPVGSADWRCRFAPEVVGDWQYRVRATDSSGISESGSSQFSVVESGAKGYVRVGLADPRFFEFSSGGPFVAPLINIEENSPLNTLSEIRVNIQRLGQNGVSFVRWWPTSDGASWEVSPFAGDQQPYWSFGVARTQYDDVDSSNGSRLSWSPYYYSAQNMPGVNQASYRLTFRARVTGEQVLRAEIRNLPGGRIDICSDTNTQHGTCNTRNGGWQSYEVTASNSNNQSVISLGLRGLYVSADAPTPFDQVRSGTIRIGVASLQRDETGNGGWGPNLLYHGDPDNYRYVDQVGAARLDEILAQSEQYGVYHKLPLFNKNDTILNRFNADGSIGAWDSTNDKFYIGAVSRWYQRAYTRYFMGRWSYSPALHSLELANETNPWYQPSYDASLSLAQYVHATSARPLLMSASFWHSFPASQFWSNPEMDFADKHWYGNTVGEGCEVWGCEIISNIWRDSAAYVRECDQRFSTYRSWMGVTKPIVRGEGGVTVTGTAPQHPDVGRETEGIFYHKKVWAHVGTLGDSCDGEWYPRLFVSGGAYPNATYNTEQKYRSYAAFMADEPVNNGAYEEIGTDLTGAQQVRLATSPSAMRAWGSVDRARGRTLIWIDNSNHTWQNVVNGVVIPSVSNTLTVTDVPPGTYAVQWWDTVQGTVPRSEQLNVGSNRELSLVVNNLDSDAAVKLVNQSLPQPSPTQTPTPTPVSYDADLDDDGDVDVDDYDLLLLDFGRTGSPGFIPADIVSNGRVDIFDFNILIGLVGS